MQKTQTTCLVILATIAVGFSLAYLKTVLLPFVIALFIVIGCRPILEYVEFRLKLHRYLAFFVTFFVGVLMLFGFAFLVWASINDLGRNSADYEARLNNIVIWIGDHLPESENDDLTDPVPPNPDGEADVLANEGPPQLAQDPARAVREFLAYASTYIRGQMLGLASSFSTLLSYGVLILIFVFFLLLGNSEFAVRDSTDEPRPAGIVGDIEEQIRRYLLLKTVISFFTGLVFGAVLWMFGVPLAIVFGFLAFLLNYIPNFGPLISMALPVPFLVLDTTMSPMAAIVCFILIVGIQFVSGNVIETRMMGKSFDVSPVFLLIALMFFGLVWGIVGMFLATPIVSIIKIVLNQSNSSRPIAELMAGRINPLVGRVG